VCGKEYMFQYDQYQEDMILARYNAAANPLSFVPTDPPSLEYLFSFGKFFYACMLIRYLLLLATWATNSGFDPKVNLTMSSIVNMQ
jgi:hypothetical protein